MSPTGSGVLVGLLQGLRAERVQRWTGRTLAALLLVGAAWYAVRLFWEGVAPATPMPVAAVDLAPGALAGRIAARHVFGEAPTLAVSQPTSNLTLRGIIAGMRPGERVAIVGIDGQPTATVAEGHDIRPGIRLEKVFATHIEIARDGVRETLSLPSRTPR